MRLGHITKNKNYNCMWEVSHSYSLLLEMFTVSALFQKTILKPLKNKKKKPLRNKLVFLDLE